MTAVLEAPERVECHEAVDGRDGWEPCERPASTFRLDDEGYPYPVCRRHKGSDATCTCPAPGRRRDRILVGTCPHCVVVRARLHDNRRLAGLPFPAAVFLAAVTENA
jgi:hypothetical protein